MKFTTKISVVRHDWVRYSVLCPRGSGYCEDSGQVQKLIKEYFIGNYRFWTSVLAEEDVPIHVAIESAIYGYYSGVWKSKFEGYI